MAKSMEVYGSEYIEEYIEVSVDTTIEITAEDVQDFIKEFADKYDLEKIKTALNERAGKKYPATVEYDIKREIADKIINKYSLAEMLEFEKQLEP